MDIWQLIENDHANIAQLIHETPNALNGPGVVRSRERLLGDLIDELDRHGAALAASLFPPLRRDPRTARLVDELAHEHTAYMRDLRALARRGGGTSGWLNRFEDVTYAVDQCLHRHVHELAPAARERLSADAVERAGHAYVRAKIEALRRRGDGLLAGADLVGAGAAAGAAIAAVAGLALLAWRLAARSRHAPESSSGNRYGRPSSRSGIGRGQSLSDRAADAAPGQRRESEDPWARQERLLDEAIEETFPASDPIAPKRITR
ncbi:hemerythrin domain-containing protein [Methylobacterium radiodurans]|uniref:Hemerythrin domain-containing protein n=1 Tax=Methylobacterium radiodurans TaxID=2202828 RepID=A0A2U8VY86_9HYPH|nr:hemerythrin domain-containing protein [Methylobacterium radiodurans]AWN38733.1 hemerythrin domain-containing protein [Methylobacterium radiodurans]